MVSARYASPKMGRAAGLLLMLSKLLQCIAITSKVPAILALHHERPTLLQKVENTVTRDYSLDEISDGTVCIAGEGAEPLSSQQVSGEGLMNRSFHLCRSRSAVEEFQFNRAAGLHLAQSEDGISVRDAYLYRMLIGAQLGTYEIHNRSGQAWRFSPPPALWQKIHHPILQAFTCSADTPT